MCLGTVREHIERIYRRAGSKKLWFVYRCHYVPFGLHLFFFFLMCLQKVKLVPYMLREGEERTVLLTILYCFIAAEDLVCNA